MSDAENGFGFASQLQTLLNDARAWSEQLQRAQTRMVEPLPPCPTMPRDCVFQVGSARLYRYRPTVAVKRSSPPIVLVFALINRADILDLGPDRSLIRRLLDAGRAVYLLDWGDPTPAQARWGLEHYVCDVMAPALATFAGRAIDLMGVCQGGTLALLYAACFPAQIRKLVVMISTIDFHTDDNLIRHWVRDLDVPAMTTRFPLIPQAMIAQAFEAMRPFKLHFDKWSYLIDHAEDPPALNRFRWIERWRLTGPDHAGQAFAEYLQWFYQRNALLNDTVVLGQQRLDFAALRMPVLGIYATYDHIVPIAGARALSRLLPHCLVEAVEVPTGHIGVYVSQQMPKVANAIVAFTAGR